PGPPPAAAPLAAQPPVARSLSSPGSGTAQRIAPKTPSTVVVPTDSEVALQEPDGESVDEPGPAAHEQARPTPSDADGAPETSPQSLTAQPPDRELLESLAPHEALLFVQSSADANVYVHGVEVGRTNRWLRSHCGFRFIRLGTAPGRWLSKGIPAKLRCRAANELELPPSP